MKSNLTDRNNQRGLSLVELLVALAISSILLLGMSSIYLDSRKTDRLGTALSRIQETGRFAINFLAKDIRMAGYQGCMDPETLEINIIADNPPTTNLFDTALRGYEVDDNTWANGEEFDNTDIEADALIGSDVIAIQRASVADTELTGNMGTDNANIQITTNPMGFAQNDIVVIADCENADMFRISSTPSGGTITLAHADNVNSGPKLSTPYGEGASIMFFESIVYFVASTGRTNARGDAINALYRQSDTLANTAASSFVIDELVEGVDSLQILYGERLASGNIHYVPADEVGDMLLVEGIRLGLLVSSVDRVQEADDNLSYELPGETISPVGAAGAVVTHAIDQRIRRDFSITINLRNRQ
mgnify:CR=1 FL=1